ncbi:MAG TPA: hypothetical protein VKP88_00790 [Candidatus Paceibacterota bacterium]|nr:hypothetical protein [Candidatus Paceibacterota bacterium]
MQSTGKDGDTETMLIIGNWVKRDEIRRAAGRNMSERYLDIP